MAAKTRLSTKGQMVVPKEAREKLELQPGDELLVDVRDGEMIVRKAPRSWTEWGAGLGKEIWSGVDVDEFMRKERSSWSRKSS